MAIVLIFINLFFLESALSQSNPITLKDGKEFYELGLHLDILEDKSKKLTIEATKYSTLKNKFNILKQQMYVTNFEHMTQNLELGGDLNLSAGKVIELDMKSYDGKEATPNNLIGGKYIVTEITHEFLPNNYMMKVKAQKDSAAIDYNEQIIVPKEESMEEDIE